MPYSGVSANRSMDMAHFTKGFGRYVCEGDKITCDIEGFKLTATVYLDDSGDAPWERDDGRGPVSDWTTRDKAPGERALCQDRSYKRYYDFQEACKIAQRDGWGCEGGQLP